MRRDRMTDYHLVKDRKRDGRGKKKKEREERRGELDREDAKVFFKLLCISLSFPSPLSLYLSLSLLVGSHENRCEGGVSSFLSRTAEQFLLRLRQANFVIWIFREDVKIKNSWKQRKSNERILSTTDRFEYYTVDI